MSKKDEVICSSNKYLRKLVNVYIMLFIQKKKKTEKKLKKKQGKSLIYLPLFARLLLKVEICYACKCNLVDLTFRAFVGVHFRTYIAFLGYFSLGKTSGPTAKAAVSETLL